ncbi:lipid kinase YegS [Cognatilysobacter bugurensis]|uniref:Probable lipid kinase YegS-like n=1 Tax=Cognatilysobacter bugurensis TaxID=543356 RepID=A0A918T269_9GAMM|nr:lipid kinase YegS [Lysobacter bugurensis]GHA85887.1 putative lipid kinase YegS-like protein [Lysobacter bugurensis]
MSPATASCARWRLILNGKSVADEDVREAVAHVRARGIDLGVRVTWEGGDAARYVAEAIADRVDTVIAGGGDGTLSEVASALAATGTPAHDLPSLGLLPLGTANDFAVATRVPVLATDAFDLIDAHPPRPIDLLRIEADGRECWCANLASGGFGTRITLETDEGLKRVLGGLAYLITGISRLGSIDPIAARVRGPAFEWSGDFIALGIGNGRQAGGGQALCPDAQIDDGALDLTIVPPLTGELGATVGALITEGKEAALDRVAVEARLPWIEIAADPPFTLNLDGEPVEARHFRIDCVPGRVRMHLPPDSPLLSAVAPGLIEHVATVRIPADRASS